MGDSVLHKSLSVSEHASSCVDHGQNGENVGVLMIDLFGDVDAAEEFRDLLGLIVVAQKDVQNHWGRRVDLVRPEYGLGGHFLVDGLGRQVQMYPVELTLWILAQQLQDDLLGSVKILQLIVEFGLFKFQLELWTCLDRVKEVEGLC